MPGLIFDLDAMAGRLELTGECEAGHKVVRRAWLPPSAPGMQEHVAAGPPPADVLQSPGGRGVVTGKRDELVGRDYAALLGEARELGYVEQPAPNRGVAMMRVKNYLRGRRK